MEMIIFHNARLQGSALVPPAKSEAHRALLLAALGRGECRLNGFQPPLCDDTQAMINGITALGARVTAVDGALWVRPAPDTAPSDTIVECDVRACAAALRMLIPVFLARGQAVRFTMDDGLYARPLDAFEPLIHRVGGRMTRCAAAADRRASVEIAGHMKAGEYAIDGTLSSQYASGMLIALSCACEAEKGSRTARLTVARPIVSRPYIDMTLRVMARFGRGVTELEEGAFSIAAPAMTQPDKITVAGDWSQAAVMLCVNAMGGNVIIDNLPGKRGNEVKGDAAILDVLSRMGMRTLRAGDALYAVSPSRAALSPVDVNCADMPDVAPMLALTCTQARGRSTLRGVGRLRVKECDRLNATVTFLNALGARVELGADGDTLSVWGRTPLKGGIEADAHHDHRMVMLYAAAALICSDPIAVRGAEALSKSWPGFLTLWRSLGGIIE